MILSLAASDMVQLMQFLLYVAPCTFLQSQYLGAGFDKFMGTIAIVAWYSGQTVGYIIVACPISPGLSLFQPFKN